MDVTINIDTGFKVHENAYADLSPRLRCKLLARYLDALCSLVPCDRDLFLLEYQVLAIQRNLQILGAFAFLSHRRNKVFFRQYLKPALQNLSVLLDETELCLPRLAGLVSDCQAALS